ncbi:MAG: hypothetical protein ABI073_02285 [Luteolibacter sp.]
MIFIVLAMLALPVGVAIALIWFFSSRNKPPQYPQGPGIQERLLEIDALRAKNLISDAEHEEKRKQILNGV